jgi:DNA-binding HxlR family transcriptional regulator
LIAEQQQARIRTMARGYGQYCPVALASEILGERWTMLVILALIDGAWRLYELSS